jgi:hypothetical protein
MMNRTLAIFVFLFVLSSIALAHGNQTHVMGTVTNISENSVSVETTSKKTVTVNISAATKFVKSGLPVTLKDLKVGDRVVIHATGPEDKLVASEVRFGSMPKEGMSGMDHTHP